VAGLRNRWTGAEQRAEPAASARPALIAAGVALLLAIAYLLAPLMGGDLSAQLARADFAAAHPLTPVDLRWFGGTLPLGYSLWVPAVMAALGVRVVGAIAAVAATWLTTRLFQRAGAVRPTLGGILAALCQASNLAEGRIAFAAGLVCGLGALLILSTRAPAKVRLPAAALAALLAGAANPVAALLLWLCAAIALLRGQRMNAAILLIASAVPVAVISGVFADGGRQLFNPSDAARAALVSLLVAALVPRRYPVIRAGAALGLVMVVAAYLLPTPVGGNAIRLSLLFAVPVVGAFVAAGRWWIAALAVLVTAVVQTPITLGTLTGAGAPATKAGYYAPMVAAIRAAGPVTGRVEVPELTGHWEAVYVARQLPLARGWLRQVDTELNGPVFYDHPPTSSNYQTWLATNAVQYVALPRARLTYYGKREAALITAGLPCLHDIWHNDQWTLYEVSDPVAIVAAPATLISQSADKITFTAPAGVDVRINVRWFSWLGVDAGCIRRDGDSVLFTGDGSRATYVLSSGLDGGSHHC
jgi:hypothetical protein